MKHIINGRYRVIDRRSEDPIHPFLRIISWGDDENLGDPLDFLRK
jgi:hypothetical protein